MSRNRRGVKEPGRSTKTRLRKLLFERDGFYWHHGEMWMAFCAFGCGELIWGINATLDHYPIKQRDGGRWVVSNLRLACRPCNSADRNHKLAKPSKRKVKIQERLSVRRNERIKAGRPTKSDLEWLANRDNEIANRESKLSGTPNYRSEIKKKLRENYPPSAGRDRNGIPVQDRPVIYDVAKGKFRYD